MDRNNFTVQLFLQIVERKRILSLRVVYLRNNTKRYFYKTARYFIEAHK